MQKSKMQKSKMQKNKMQKDENAKNDELQADDMGSGRGKLLCRFLWFIKIRNLPKMKLFELELWSDGEFRTAYLDDCLTSRR